jgi:AbrB family looped-hinge helix DNA binding protein
MPSAMVTFNGRITLPNDIRKQLGLKPGDKVEFVEIGKGEFALRPRTEAADSAAELGTGVSSLASETVQ